MKALRRLAASYGVRPFYRDVEGVRRDPTPDALLATLRALGEPVEAVADAGEALAGRRYQLAQRKVEPVCVVWQGEAAEPPGAVRVRLAGRVECRLELESGEIRTWTVNTDALPVVGRRGPPPLRRLPLPRQLAAGYHRLSVTEVQGGQSGESHVLVAPRRLYDGGVERQGAGTAGWGVFEPVYAIRRSDAHHRPAELGVAGDWGVGDFTGLEQLGRWVAGLGGTAVATLPMLAAFLYEDPEGYSPYAPASRLFWNELFVDPTRLPELAASPKAQRLLASDGLRRAVAKLSASRYVDVGRAAALKRQVLEPLAEAFFAEGAPTARRDALAQLRRQQPDLDRYAAFRAACERHGVGWQAWPERLRRGGSAAGLLGADDYDPRTYRFHLYAQLVAAEQVAQAGETLAANGGLYLDLPLGVDPSSYDVWRQPELFAQGASAGAPPDPIFSDGQDWGFHPIHPEHQRESGYRHLRAVLRHHLAHAGTLRIDHVMQLHRLFWVPQGIGKRDGVYVSYPAEELYAVLSLESHRHRTRVVGENLGTVPAYVDRALSRHGLLKMYVLPFRALPPVEDGAAPLAQPVAADEVASLNTHDLPPFRAWWLGEDIADRHDLGLLDAAEADIERQGRLAERREWVRRLAVSGHLRDVVDGAPLDCTPRKSELPAQEILDDLDSAAASRAVHAAALAWLGDSASPLVLVSLQDLWGESSPHNVPGTWKERPNWQLRAAHSLGEIAADEALVRTLHRLDAARRNEPASPAPTAHLATAPLATAPLATAPLETARAETQSRHHPGTPSGAAALTPGDDTMQPVPNRSLLTDDDLFLFNQGRHFSLGESFGARRRHLDGVDGYNFTVWAPSAEAVSVVGDFNAWEPGAHPLHPRGASGVWEGFLPAPSGRDLAGAHYKFLVRSRHEGHTAAKADPFALRSEMPPNTGSILWHLDYDWGDGEWMEGRGATAALDAPVSIYEIHLGSWRRAHDDGHRFLSYRELAEPLADHCLAHGFTHVELLPVTEHPFYGSWGYQCTGYFAATSRYGTPQDLMALIDHLHQRGLGVILDWVPSHFPADDHGLGFFDGTHLFEHADPRQGYHPDWNSYIFNYERPEVRSFLISSALHWLQRFHADGLRVDAVASMLMRNYSRDDGEWIPNRYGGAENLEAVELLQQLNVAVAEHAPGARTFAEESTAWPGVTRPVLQGGLGFDYKWDMGWMHDTLTYFKREPIHRKFHQNELTFRGMYAWSEEYLMPLSHDEVVHGKRSLVNKMPGDEWRRFANLRLLYGYQWMSPGKKLLFMGGEFAQLREWDHDWSLEWHLLERPLHRGMSRWVADLNDAYRGEAALHELDASPDGFRWVDTSDHERSLLSFLRLGKAGEAGDLVLAILNLTPEPWHAYRLGVPRPGLWEERLNSDAEVYGGSGLGNLGGVEAEELPLHDYRWSVSLTLPPSSLLLLRSAAPVEE